MMAKPDACAEMLCEVPNVVGVERRKRRNTFLILVAASFVALANWFVIISALFEQFGSERRYASNFGVSISRCQEIFQIIGTPENGQCSRRVPKEHKSEMQLAIEIMVMKTEPQDMRDKRPLQPWHASERLAKP
jgi:hypothetical protein